MIKDYRVHRPVVQNVPQPLNDGRDDQVVTYKDAITTIDLSSLFYYLGFQYRRAHTRSLWVVRDCCGLFCAVFTWLLIVFAEYVMWYFILLPSIREFHNFVNGVIFLGFSCLAAISHIRAMFTDPGAVPRGNATRENIEMLRLGEGQVVYRCSKCVSIKPNRAHHCSVCRRCIRKMDHHCPWINNCVGENNQKYFILFTMYICIISVHAFYLATRHLVLCPFADSKECSRGSPVLSLVLTVLLLFESVLFSVFTCIMFLTQISAVWTDTTGIENVKRQSHLWERKAGWHSVRLVFGHQFSYCWFLPIHSNFIKVGSYDYDCDYSV